MAENFKILIPARIGSERLSRKLLQKVGDKTIIQMTWERCVQSKADEVIVVTDSDEIFDLIIGLNGRAFLSQKNHDSGTDRIQEYVEIIGLKPEEIIINVQGDEPLIEIEAVNKLGSFMHENNYAYATIAKHFSSNSDLLDLNKVKVILDDENRALEFFRDTPNRVKDVSKEVQSFLLLSVIESQYLRCPRRLFLGSDRLGHHRLLRL